jgi:hypothetical protein
VATDPIAPEDDATDKGPPDRQHAVAPPAKAPGQAPASSALAEAAALVGIPLFVAVIFAVGVVLLVWSWRSAVPTSELGEVAAVAAPQHTAPARTPAAPPAPRAAPFPPPVVGTPDAVEPPAVAAAAPSAGEADEQPQTQVAVAPPPPSEAPRPAASARPAAPPGPAVVPVAAVARKAPAAALVAVAPKAPSAAPPAVAPAPEAVKPPPVPATSGTASVPTVAIRLPEPAVAAPAASPSVRVSGPSTAAIAVRDQPNLTHQAGAAEAAAETLLLVSSRPASSVWIDGSSVGRSNQRYPVEPGVHQLVFKTDDGRERQVEVLAPEGQTTRTCWSFDDGSSCGRR